MKIGIVSQFYAPEPGPATLPANLAEELARRGHAVKVVTGFPNYPSGKLAPGYRLQRRQDEVRAGVHIRRVYLHPDHGSAPGRAANYGTFGISSIVNGLTSLRGADAVWVNASPITLAWPIGALRVVGVPVVSHILDLWPESLYATNFGTLAQPAAARRLIGAWTGSMYRMSDLVVYISPGVGEILKSRGVPADKLRYVPMWADESTFHPGGSSMRGELGIRDDAVVVLYAGALGDAQGLETLISACRDVRDPRFLCVIAGDGGNEAELRRQAQGQDNIRFIGRVPQAAMTDLMASADASFVSLKDTALGRVSTPSKTQAALASGLPVIAAARGDVRHVVENAGVGFGADPRHIASVTAALEQLCRMPRSERQQMGCRARQTYEDQFSLGRAASQVEAMLLTAAKRRGKRR